MQHLILFPAVVFSACLLYACSSNNTASTAKDSTSQNNTTDSNGDSLYYGKSSLAYSINGRHVAIKDNLKQGEGKYILALFLNTVKNNTDEGMVKINLTNSLAHEVFNFFIANKSTTTVLKTRPELANILNNKAEEATYMGTDYTNYYGESVEVAITAMDDKHVSGTF